MRPEGYSHVGRYQLPVNRPLFDTNITPNDPVFHSVLNQWPLFFQKIQGKTANFSRASRAFQFFFINFQQKYLLKSVPSYTEWAP